MVIRSTPVTWMVNSFSADSFVQESWTFRQKVYEPVRVGVPEMLPVEALRLNPGGSIPPQRKKR